LLRWRIWLSCLLCVVYLTSADSVSSVVFLALVQLGCTLCYCM
jgi:hypothetical protein